MSFNFRQFQAFFQTALKAQLRNPSAVFFGFIFPLVFIFSFGFVNNIGSSEIKLGLINVNSPSFIFFEQELKQSRIFTLENGNLENLQTRLEKSDLDGILEVTQSGPKLIAASGSSQNKQIIIQSINSILDKQLLANNQDKLTPTGAKLQINEIKVYKSRYIDFVLPGLLGFSLLSAGVATTSFNFFALRRIQALKRIFATPAKPINFILGQSASQILFSFAQNLLLIICAVLFFQFAPRNGFLGILEILPIVLLGVIAFLGMGYIVAATLKTEEQATPVVNLIILPQFILAGTFFPVENLPSWLQSMAKLLPLYNFNEAMRMISIDGYHLNNTNLLEQIGFLFLWILIIYLIAARFFRVR